MSDQIDFQTLSPEQLVEILSQLFQPDTEKIKKATSILKAYFKTPMALKNLVLLMSQNPDQNIRQVSCVYLRKVITNQWLNLQPEDKVHIKTLLLTRFVEEPVTLVKKNIADVIGSLGKILIPNKDWMELFQFVQQRSSSENLADRELAILLLSVIIEYFSIEDTKAHHAVLNGILSNFLQSEHNSLKTLAIETVMNFAASTQSLAVLKKYGNLIPLVIAAIDPEDQDMIQKVFETLLEFTESKSIIKPHVFVLLDAALQASANTEYNDNVREISMHFVECLADKNAKMISKTPQALDSVVRAAFQICAEDEQDFEDNYDNPIERSLDMLYNYAAECSSARFFPVALKYIQSCGVSNNPLERKAAIRVLGHISDSDTCMEQIKDNIDDLAQFVSNCLQDKDFVVREGTAITVGQLSENIVPEFLEKHDIIIPSLLKVLKELTPKNDQVMQKALYAAHQFCENLQDDIKDYITVLVQSLVPIVMSDFSRDCKYWALQALGSVCSSGEKLMKPFVQDLLQMLEKVIEMSGQTEANVRGAALVCVGHLAAAVGRENFPAEKLEQFTQFGLQAIKEEKQELRETAISYFAEIVKILKTEIQPIIPQILEEVLKSIASQGGIRETTMDQINAENKKKDFSLDSDSEEGDDEVVGMDIDINFLDEKSSAVHCLGHLCLFAMPCLVDRLPDILKELKEITKYFHENIRYHVCMTYTQIAIGLAKLRMGDFERKMEWKKGLPVQLTLHPDVLQFLDQVAFPHYLETFADEQNKEVIEKLLECYVDIADALGPGAFTHEGYLSQLLDFLNRLLRKESYCQTKAKDFAGEIQEDGDFEDDKEANAIAEEEEDEDEEEEIDHDELILGNTTDVILELSKCFGDQFAPLLAKLAPSLAEYMKDNHPPRDRSMAIGCLAEVFNQCPAALPTYFEQYFQVVLKNCQQPDNALNRNLAYALAVLLEQGQNLIVPHIDKVLEVLKFLYDKSEEKDAKENVVAAICRVVQYHNHASAPELINFVAENIPFEQDANENETVLKCLFALYQNKPELVKPHWKKVILTCLKIFCDEIKCDEVSESFKTTVAAPFFKNTFLQDEEAKSFLQGLEGGMSEQEKNLLQKYLA